MLQKTYESQADQKLGRAAAWSLAKARGDLLERVGALTAAPGRHACLQSGAVSGERWIQPGIIQRSHLDDGSHLGLGLTEDLSGPRLHMGEPRHLPTPARRPRHRTVRVEAPPPGPQAGAAHGEPGGTQGHALRVAMRCRARGGRMLASAGMEGNDGGEGVGLEQVLDTIRVEATVVDDSAHRARQRMGGAGLQEAVETGRPHGAGSAVGGSQPDMDGEGMLRGDDPVRQEAVAAKVGVAVRSIPPRGRGIAGPARMVTAADAVGPAVTGGPAVGASACGERGAIAAAPQGLEIASEAPLDRGEHTTGKAEGFQAGAQLLGPGLVSRREQLLGQARGDRRGLRGLPGLRGVPVGLFLLQVASRPPFAWAARTDAMGTRRGIRAIFEAVEKGGEGADRRRLEGRKARALREARMGAQVVGPLREPRVVQQPHEQEGPQHTDGIVGGPTTGARSIEGPHERASRVEIEAQEHQRGLVPRLRPAASLAAQPALERAGEGGTILGMRWGHRRFLLGHKGKPLCDDGSIVPRSGAAGQVAGFFACCPSPRQPDVGWSHGVLEVPIEPGREIFE